LVWAPAELDWPNGGAVAALVPVRYPSSATSDDSAIRMSRKTGWLQPESDVFIGLGQRLLATDSGEYPLLEVREIALQTGPEEPAHPRSEIADGTPGSDG
jgi:type VI secretion system protein ImpE